MKNLLSVIASVFVAIPFLVGCHEQNPYEKFIRARAEGDQKAMKEAYIEIMRDELDRQWWERNGADWYPEPGR